MFIPRSAIRLELFVLVIFLMIIFGNQAILNAQGPVPSGALQPVQNALTPAELDSMVAPIALYPDPLVSQVLVASTYPMEVVQAAQWLQQNPRLSGQTLQNVAQQQNWDPSVQALLVFPDVLRLLAGNVQWMTNLGNAFLDQQSDVMESVQRMRSQAQSSGTLASGPQMTVTNQQVAGAPAPVVVIQPTNPQVMYVPVYDPLDVWGRPFYPYPVLGYPPAFVARRSLSFFPGVVITASFGGWNGWSAWGWGANWIGRTVVVNNNFFYRYGFRRPAVAVIGRAPAVWVHDPVHRWGVPYAYRQSAVRSIPGPRPAFVNGSALRPSAAFSGVTRFAPAGSGYRSVAPPRAVTERPTVREGYASRPRSSESFRESFPSRSVESGRGAVRDRGRSGERRRSR